jgi:uncharacterized RDD family membrane protein YckC
MFCSKCGSSLPDGAAFCPTCGHPTVSFTPPEPESVELIAARPQVHYAGFWLRLFAIVIDSAVLSIVLWPLMFWMFLRAGLITVPPGEPLGQEEIMQRAGTIFAVEAMVFVVVGLYYSLMESSPWQATLGKRALRLQVTDLQGRRISFGRATGRYFAKIVSGLTLSIGYLMAGFTQRKQALHDIIAECLVVRKPRP